MYISTKNYMSLCSALIMLCHYGKSSAWVPNGTACYANYELSLFCFQKEYAEAKKSCEENDSYLVKIDNANMTESVNYLINKTECLFPEDFFIGAKATPHPDFPNEGSKRIWKWLDGSKIFLPNELGYQNWQSGQPNDFGGSEDCLIIGRYSKKWKDTNCVGTNTHREARFYICQKMALLEIDAPSSTEKECVASAGSCESSVEWRRKDEAVSRISNSTVYQTSLPGSSILHYENAKIGDVGEYFCYAWLSNDETDLVSATTKIYVNGTPVLVKIHSFACNSSLLVEWKPNISSLGYPHRITATPTSDSSKIPQVIEVTPTKPHSQSTEIVGLESSIEYNVEVVACITMNDCPSEYATNKTVPARGKIAKVSNVKIQQNNATNNDRCIVSWDWSGDIAATLQINLDLEPAGSIEKVRLNNTRIYSFDPIFGQAYIVGIQPVAAENICPNSVVAVGSCVGQRVQEENDPWKIGGLNFMILIPSAAVGTLILLSIGTVWFCKRTKTSSVDDEVNPGTPVPPDYEHLHSSSNQDEVDAEGSSDGAVAYSTAADPQSFVDGPIYASVYNPKIQVVVEEEGSNEMNISTEPSASTNAESMVINPIYDMEEASTLTANHDVAEASTNDPSTSGTTEKDQELETEDPIYTAVNKVKMINDKTVRQPTNKDE